MEYDNLLKIYSYFFQKNHLYFYNKIKKKLKNTTLIDF